MTTRSNYALAVFVFCVATLIWRHAGGVLPDVLPPSDPPPIDAPGLNVLVVYETEGHDANTIDSTLWHQYVIDKGGDYETFDADADVSKAQAKWRDAFRIAASGELPVVVVSNGRTGAVAPLPGSPAAMIELISKYADG